MSTPLDAKMPEKIARLPQIAYNLWWSWTPEARNLFRKLDYPLWRVTKHNPVQMLQDMSEAELERAANDPVFYRQYTKVLMAYDQLLNWEDTWFYRTYPDLRDQKIGYFSAEFGIHQSLPIYSGGLGILSGDHAKEASDLGLPLIGVGFMYPQGYFRQRIPSHGWQEAIYEQVDLRKAPIRRVYNNQGDEVRIQVRIGDRPVFARLWYVQVGRTPLYLMDTDVDENEPWDRELSARLYSGGSELRIRQEMMLGIGGIRTLRALNLNPTTFHMNEGHSAFLVLELIRERVAQGASFTQAAEAVRRCTIFTTHTPVPAGHDAFPFHMVEKYFWGYWDELGLNREQFMELASHNEPWGIAFNMTVLALKMAGQANGVSKLHGQVSRQMWRNVWPERSEAETPITHITNGIHLPTWVASQMDHLYRKYLSPDWLERQDDPLLWARVVEIPDQELWQAHVAAKHKLIQYLQERLRRQWKAGDVDSTHVLVGGALLDPDALTIGFARRFATYKRATLIFRDLDRLLRLLHDIHRPVQIIFGGKAHPADDPGKLLIQQIYNYAKYHGMAGRIALIEDYDMHIARLVKQGVDVWLNTPRRPREASGTSGMKASLNGVPNLSVLDGWWVEGYTGSNGWAIGTGQDYASEEAADAADAQSLYELLEREVVPLYYERDRDDIPRGWVAIMREAIRTVSPQFSTCRMVKDYTQQLYIQALQQPAPTI